MNIQENYLYEEYKESRAGLLLETGADRFIDISNTRKNKIVNKIDDSVLIANLSNRERQFRINHLLVNSEVRFEIKKENQND